MYKRRTAPLRPIIFYKPEKDGHISRRRRRRIKFGWNVLKANRDCFRDLKEVDKEYAIRKKEKEEWRKFKGKAGRKLKRIARCEKYFEAKGRGRIHKKKEI